MARSRCMNGSGEKFVIIWLKILKERDISEESGIGGRRVHKGYSG